MLITVVALVLAALPLVMTLANAPLLRTPKLPLRPPSVAILIPARNEEQAISRCVAAALASRGADIEVLVLDDGSTDRTAAIVRKLMLDDPRLRLVESASLPPGWNGKQHACWMLSAQATRPNLLFIDADVVLAPEGAARLAPPAGTDLVSGVPRQVMATLAEGAAIPMINALLLGYLPMAMMRRSQQVSLAAGCGQMMMVRAEAYRAVGGHGAIRASLHDGLKLPRAFRAAGFRTDLVNGANLAECRMYVGAAALWTGFLKNATEGMAKPVALPVWTLLLFGGHVLPWLLLFDGLARGAAGWRLALVGVACALPPIARCIQARVCREPLRLVPLHPFGVLLTLAIQWTALVRRSLGRRTEWRGRTYLAEN